MINQVVIFAGGKGTRLGIDNAKCLVEIGGEPIINYICRQFSNQGVNKFHFCLGFYADETIAHLKKLGINFSYSFDPFPCCGTWEALKSAEEFLEDTFFVTYGDSVVYCDLNFMYWQFIESGQTSLMSFSNFQSPQSNFEIDLSKENTNRLTDGKNYNFVEHGITIFSKKALNKELTNKPFNFSDYFRTEIGAVIHFANANYYQINTPEDHAAVDKSFNQFKTKHKYNFLDRDGTINQYDSKIYETMNFVPNTSLLELLDDSECVIITNQPDKAKFGVSLTKINRMTHDARQFLISNGHTVMFSETCIHRDIEKNGEVFDDLKISCNCRKPDVGMLLRASKRITISEDSMFYGDSDCDEECAKNFGIKFTRM